MERQHLALDYMNRTAFFRPQVSSVDAGGVLEKLDVRMNYIQDADIVQQQQNFGVSCWKTLYNTAAELG